MHRASNNSLTGRIAQLTAVLLVAGVSAACAGSPAAPAPPAGSQTATFAMGCFWSAESAFEGLPGVTQVLSGYTGGTMKNPSYEDVSSQSTGHFESVRVTYDPKKIGYAQLLDVFWHNIDPTAADGQLYDRGPEYRTAIFVADEAQKRVAEATKHRIETTPQRFKGPVATLILPASTFYVAEDYHQDYAKKNSMAYQAYRIGSGRDRRLTELWGKPGRQGGH